MVIIHEIMKLRDLTTQERALIRKLSKRRIISTVVEKGTIGIARAGTNRGRDSQLAKYVREFNDNNR